MAATPQAAVGLKASSLGLFSAAAIVVGSMIGSGIFIVSADIIRTLGNAQGLLAVWIFTGLLTLLGAYSYGKLAAKMPTSGGQYVYLREAWGKVPAFLYGWALFVVIQTGTLAAVAVAFGKFLGVMVPGVNSAPLLTLWPGMALSSQQLVASLLILGLTALNCTGVQNAAIVQNIFTALKALALIGLVACGLLLGTHHGVQPLTQLFANSSASIHWGAFGGIFAAATVGALFSSDAWNNVTFIGTEVKQGEKVIPKALVMGTGAVVLLYLLANIAYLNVMPIDTIAHAPEDRVATAMMSALFGDVGAVLMAAVILVSTFGCLNGMILAGARVFYTMACDGILFKPFAQVDAKTQAPTVSLWVQGIWSALLVFTGQYGQLLDFVIFAALLFYVLTVVGLFKLNGKPGVGQIFSQPVYWLIPILYVLGASFVAIHLVVDSQKMMTSLIGLGLVFSGLIPYFWLKLSSQSEEPSTVVAI